MTAEWNVEKYKLRITKLIFIECKYALWNDCHLKIIIGYVIKNSNGAKFKFKSPWLSYILIKFFSRGKSK